MGKCIIIKLLSVAMLWTEMNGTTAYDILSIIIILRIRQLTELYEIVWKDTITLKTNYSTFRISKMRTKLHFLISSKTIKTP